MTQSPYEPWIRPLWMTRHRASQPVSKSICGTIRSSSFVEQPPSGHSVPVQGDGAFSVAPVSLRLGDLLRHTTQTAMPEILRKWTCGRLNRSCSAGEGHHCPFWKVSWIPIDCQSDDISLQDLSKWKHRISRGFLSVITSCHMKSSGENPLSINSSAGELASCNRSSSSSSTSFNRIHVVNANIGAILYQKLCLQ